MSTLIGLCRFPQAQVPKLPTCTAIKKGDRLQAYEKAIAPPTHQKGLNLYHATQKKIRTTPRPITASYRASI
ncbi:hypothetical protein [Fischerella sp. PCC 9605]|uniref:hypothetical protein n=1 Tax=Fischerella sp. PCC 9605 TaxID=1173024 RepID=UPI0012DE684D|nr:hypothetical protein [Fischerella sp. PCC 9605]